MSHRRRHSGGTNIAVVGQSNKAFAANLNLGAIVAVGGNDATAAQSINQTQSNAAAVIQS